MAFVLDLLSIALLVCSSTRMEYSLNAFSIVPSQVIRPTTRTKGNKSSAPQRNFVPLLSPSPQEISISQRLTLTEKDRTVGDTSSVVTNNNDESLDTPPSSSSRNQYPRSRRRGKRLTKKATTRPTPQNSIPLMNNNNTVMNEDPVPMDPVYEDNNSLINFPREGNLPDIYWQSIPMNHLRQHPRFQPLPLPQEIKYLKSLEECRLFRQDSWQWDILHQGRCTTSQAVAALGFLEPTTGEVLQIPPIWRRGGRGAYIRLQQQPLRTMEEMNVVLCKQHESPIQSSPVINSPSSSLASDTSTPTHHESNLKSSWWTTTATVNNTTRSTSNDTTNGKAYFAAEYNYRPHLQELQRRKVEAKRFTKDEDMAKGIRMMWGSTQETIAILTALNYFAHKEPEFLMLQEVGMCGAGLELNQTLVQSTLLVGASPDGVLCYSNGRMEALEVKNHCPFFNFRTTRKMKRGKGGKKFFLGDRPFDVADSKNNGIFSHYIPQLMLEMLCLGPECKSAVMVRQTATQGALILRMHRDDAWIHEMLYWLHRFQLDYVEANCPPPVDFFWSTGTREEQSQYRRFVNRTLELRNKVEIVDIVPSSHVQRPPGQFPMFLD